MDLRRSRWILGVVLASFALVGTLAGADEPTFTEEQRLISCNTPKSLPANQRKRGNPTRYETSAPIHDLFAGFCGLQPATRFRSR